MNVTHILCPYDFSRSSEAALKMASSLARESNAKLTILHVQETPLAFGAGIGGYIPPHPEVLPTVEELRQELPVVDGVEYEHRLVPGSPADEILRFARENSVDLIVVGTHGRTGLARLLMGSVAAAIVREAPCPVLACKAPAEPTSTDAS